MYCIFEPAYDVVLNCPLTLKLCCAGWLIDWLTDWLTAQWWYDHFYTPAQSRDPYPELVTVESLRGTLCMGRQLRSSHCVLFFRGFRRKKFTRDCMCHHVLLVEMKNLRFVVLFQLEQGQPDYCKNINIVHRHNNLYGEVPKTQWGVVAPICSSLPSCVCACRVWVCLCLWVCSSVCMTGTF